MSQGTPFFKEYIDICFQKLLFESVELMLTAMRMLTPLIFWFIGTSTERERRARKDAGRKS